MLRLAQLPHGKTTDEIIATEEPNDSCVGIMAIPRMGSNNSTRHAQTLRDRFATYFENEGQVS